MVLIRKLYSLNALKVINPFLKLLFIVKHCLFRKAEIQHIGHCYKELNYSLVAKFDYILLCSVDLNF